jgi:hypothetical protein
MFILYREDIKHIPQDGNLQVKLITFGSWEAEREGWEGVMTKSSAQGHAPSDLLPPASLTSSHFQHLLK